MGLFWLMGITNLKKIAKLNKNPFLLSLLFLYFFILFSRSCEFPQFQNNRLEWQTYQRVTNFRSSIAYTPSFICPYLPFTLENKSNLINNNECHSTELNWWNRCDNNRLFKSRILFAYLIVLHEQGVGKIRGNTKTAP